MNSIPLTDAEKLILNRIKNIPIDDVKKNINFSVIVDPKELGKISTRIGEDVHRNLITSRIHLIHSKYSIEATIDITINMHIKLSDEMISIILGNLVKDVYEYLIKSFDRKSNKKRSRKN
ncbi:MAG: hypothetical protein R1F52_02985 [Candidatus Nitrosoabyssus spongiisocia]|nr:MAG: hypothetical protein R1F52_02985 [Nitrosopumilaceae archaeon AB1(1)]